MAEAERYLPGLVGKIEKLLEHHGLQDQAITIRMTGCPNGCARPYLAEIGLVGKAPGRFNLHLGAAFNGTRLNRMVVENANEQKILKTLDQQFEEYTTHRKQGEAFGDYIARSPRQSQSQSQSQSTVHSDV
jgi:sulfite reductase (NADPH) hemoprotein beta-component